MAAIPSNRVITYWSGHPSITSKWSLWFAVEDETSLKVVIVVVKDHPCRVLLAYVSEIVPCKLDLRTELNGYFFLVVSSIPSLAALIGVTRADIGVCGLELYILKKIWCLRRELPTFWWLLLEDPSDQHRNSLNIKTSKVGIPLLCPSNGKMLVVSLGLFLFWFSKNFMRCK